MTEEESFNVMVGVGRQLVVMMMMSVESVTLTLHVAGLAVRVPRVRLRSPPHVNLRFPIPACFFPFEKSARAPVLCVVEAFSSPSNLPPNQHLILPCILPTTCSSDDASRTSHRRRI